MFNHISYQKGSLVLHTLRHIIGDDLFFASLKNYLHKFAFQSVSTDDFIRVVENTTSRDLGWFFNQWLYHGGYPEFDVNYNWKADSNMVILNIRQIQNDSCERE